MTQACARPILCCCCSDQHYKCSLSDSDIVYDCVTHHQSHWHTNMSVLRSQSIQMNKDRRRAFFTMQKWTGGAKEMTTTTRRKVRKAEWREKVLERLSSRTRVRSVNSTSTAQSRRLPEKVLKSGKSICQYRAEREYRSHCNSRQDRNRCLQTAAKTATGSCSYATTTQ